VVVCYAIEPSHPSQFKSFPLLFLPFPIWYPQPCARLIFILIRLLLNEHLADSIIRPSVRLCASILNCHQNGTRSFSWPKRQSLTAAKRGGERQSFERFPSLTHTRSDYVIIPVFHTQKMVLLWL
jgi:hypothetical protein